MWIQDASRYVASETRDVGRDETREVGRDECFCQLQNFFYLFKQTTRTPKIGNIITLFKYFFYGEIR